MLRPIVTYDVDSLLEKKNHYQKYLISLSIDLQVAINAICT